MLDLEPGNQTAHELLNHVLALKRKHLSDVRKVWQGKLASASLSGGEALTAYANASQAYHDMNEFDASVEERENMSTSKGRLLLPPAECSNTTPSSSRGSDSTRGSKPYRPNITYTIRF
jgi:hypothetical protein